MKWHKYVSLRLVPFPYQIILFIKRLVKGKKRFYFIKYDEDDGNFCADRMEIWKAEAVIFVDINSKK